MLRTATCACRRLRAITEGEPDRVLACNCIECQKRTGSVFGVSAYFHRSKLVGVEGERRSFIRTTEAGLRLETEFCPSCGTSVLWRTSALPEHVAVAVGCFGDPGFPAPSSVAWLSAKHGWVAFPAGCRAFEGSAFAEPASEPLTDA
jgi:hypothetical protein